MKFWITCMSWDGELCYEIHSLEPVWEDNDIGAYWHSHRRVSVCEGMLFDWFGEDYDLPEVGECWEFSVKDDIWIHTR